MRKYLISILILLPIVLQAQNSKKLSYKEMIAIAVRNNYDIQIAQNNKAIAQGQNSYGNAGFLPKIDLNATGNLASNNTNQQFSNGLEVNQNGVKTKNINAGAYLSWTLFDGLKMFATKERLALLAQQSELDLKIQMEQTVEATTLIYYQLVKQTQLIKGVQAAMAVSEERIKIAEKKKLLGSGSNVELLQAKMDLNAQKSDLVLQNNLLSTYRNSLNELLRTDLNAIYEVDSFFEFVPMGSIQDLHQKVETANRLVQKSSNAKLVADQQFKEAKSLRYPSIGLTTNYLFGRTQNEVGFALLNQNLGLNTGLTFSWNLFNGTKTSTQIKTASWQQQNAVLQFNKTLLSAQSATMTAYKQWLGYKEILNLEEENIQLAQQSLQIATERLKLGLSNFLETKESQRSFEEAMTRLVNARYNLKQAEIALLKSTGELLN